MDRKLFELLIVLIVAVVLVAGHYRARMAASNEEVPVKTVMQNAGPNLAALNP